MKTLFKTIFKKEDYASDHPYLNEILEYKDRRFKLQIYLGNGNSICELEMLGTDGFWRFNINNSFLRTGFRPDTRFSKEIVKRTHIAEVRQQFLDYIKLIY